MVFRLYIPQGSSHVVDTHEPVDTERRGENPGKDFPEGRYACSRPRNAGNEQQRKRSEHINHHARFPVMDEDGAGHREEDAGQQVWEDECQQRTCLSNLYQAEHLRYRTEYISRDDGVYQEVGE